MKHLLIILSLLTLGSSCKKEFGVCLPPSDILSTRLLDLGTITRVDLEVEAEVYISEGPDQEVRIEGNPELIDRLVSDSRMSGTEWKVDIDRCYQTQDLRIYLTLEQLQEIEISGFGIVRSQGVFTNTPSLDLKIDGSGLIQLDLADAQVIDMEISGSGDIELSGVTTEQRIEINGSGDVRNFGLETQITRIEISGSGDCQVDASDLLDVEINGSGSICYQGNPSISQEINGSGEVNDCN